jgi:hypothetical protein
MKTFYKFRIKNKNAEVCIVEYPHYICSFNFYTVTFRFVK